jgi:hypothetical protein
MLAVVRLCIGSEVASVSLRSAEVCREVSTSMRKGSSCGSDTA